MNIDGNFILIFIAFGWIKGELTLIQEEIKVIDVSIVENHKW